MGLTARDDCLEQLRIMIDRARLDDLAVVQDLVFRLTLLHEGRDRRGEVVDELTAALTGASDAAMRATLNELFTRL